MSHAHTAALTQFAIEHRIAILVTFLTTLVVGAIAALRIPLEMFPGGFSEQSLDVSVPWEDAPSREILEKITIPLEEELSTLRGLTNMTSYSGRGRARVSLTFKRGVEMSVAYREVRDRVERARPLFPRNADRYFINKNDISGIPISFIGVAVDERVTDSYNLIKRYVIRPFERIDGVASVNVDGLEEKEIIIELDRHKANAAGLDIYDLATKLQDDNFSMASGNVHNADKKFLLRSVATYSSISELENRLLSPNVKLKDVAIVQYKEPEKTWRVRVNSQPALAVQIYKEGDANTVEICRKIREEYDALLKDPRLADVEMEMMLDQGAVIENSIVNLLNNGKQGGILAALVLFFFLRRFRLTLIISMSIPISLLFALTVMHFTGETLNLISILALVICVGMLVDNSVVVAENIHRLHALGYSRKDSCIEGAAEISLAIIMATLTTVVVFLPVLLVEGMGQFFMIRMAIPICVSLLASLVVALAFVPLCVYLTLPKRDAKKSTSLFSRMHGKLDQSLEKWFELSFGSINHHYNKALGFFLKRRLDLVLAVLAIFLLTLAIAKDRVKFVDGQEGDQGSINVSIEMGPEYSVEDSHAYFEEVEKVLEANKERLGIRGYISFSYPGGGDFTGWLKQDRTNKESAPEISAEILELLPKKGGVKYYTDNENDAGEKDDEHTYVVRLRSEDPDKLEAVAAQLEPVFKSQPGVLGIKKSGETAPNELALIVDRDRAAASGVDPTVIAGMVGYALSGSNLPRFSQEGREIPVRIRYQESDRERLTDLGAFMVPTNTGEFLPVSSFTEPKVLNTAKGIFRENKQISRTITMEIDEKKEKEVRLALNDLKQRMDLPEGVTFGESLNTQTGDDMQNMVMAMVLSFFFIYLLMGFLFESFILPLAILVTIPMAIIGVYWGHILMGLNMDFLGMVGIILLIGVVVNNGIVLIDQIIRLRDEGMIRTEAILKATDQRFAPIAMTALTTIIGMIPLAVQKPQILAFGEGFSYKSFGVSLVGGMTTATLLTLLVVPVLYTLFDDAWIAIHRVFKRSLLGAKSNSGESSDQVLTSASVEV